MASEIPDAYGSVSGCRAARSSALPVRREPLVDACQDLRRFICQRRLRQPRPRRRREFGEVAAFAIGDRLANHQGVERTTEEGLAGSDQLGKREAGVEDRGHVLVVLLLRALEHDVQLGRSEMEQGGDDDGAPEYALRLGDSGEVDVAEEGKLHRGAAVDGDGEAVGGLIEDVGVAEQGEAPPKGGDVEGRVREEVEVDRWG